MAGFSVEVTLRRGTALMTLQGELDLYSARMLQERLSTLQAEGTHDIVVNLAKLDFIDSTGLSVLVVALKRARSAGGDVVLEAIPPRAMRVLEITGLTRVFTVRAGPDPD